MAHANWNVSYKVGSAEEVKFPVVDISTDEGRTLLHAHVDQGLDADATKIAVTQAPDS